MTSQDLLRKLDDVPFKPFRLKMVNNTVYDVFDPGMVIAGESSAVIATQNIRDEKGRRVPTEWRTISISHILEFADIDNKHLGDKRKRA